MKCINNAIICSVRPCKSQFIVLTKGHALYINAAVKDHVHVESMDLDIYPPAKSMESTCTGKNI